MRVVFNELDFYTAHIVLAFSSRAFCPGEKECPTKRILATEFTGNFEFFLSELCVLCGKEIFTRLFRNSLRRNYRHCGCRSSYNQPQ